jgi:hypothetical protein
LCVFCDLFFGAAFFVDDTFHAPRLNLRVDDECDNQSDSEKKAVLCFVLIVIVTRNTTHHTIPKCTVLLVMWAVR